MTAWEHVATEDALGRGWRKIDEGLQPVHETLRPNISPLERAATGAAAFASFAAAWYAQRPPQRVGLSLAGAGLLWRALSGVCPVYRYLGIDHAHHHGPVGVPAKHGFKYEKWVAVDAPPEALYAFWRNLENLPELFEHLESVTTIGLDDSHWVAIGPLAKRVEWNAEIINDRPDEMIAWRSIPGSDMDTAGSVHFEPRADGRTDVHLSLKYNPPGGKVGALAAGFLGESFERQIDEGLRRLQRIDFAQAAQWDRDESADTEIENEEQRQRVVRPRAGLRPDERDPDEPPGAPGSAGGGVNMAGTEGGGLAAGGLGGTNYGDGSIADQNLDDALGAGIYDNAGDKDEGSPPFARPEGNAADGTPAERRS